MVLSHNSTQDKKLSSVKRYRSLERDASRRLLQESLEQLVDHEKQLLRSQQHFHKAKQQYDQLLAAGNFLDVDVMAQYNQNMLSSKASMEALQKHYQAAVAEHQQKNQQLEHNNQQCQIMDKLIDKKRLTWMAAQEKKEANQCDELILLSHARSGVADD